MRAPAKLIPVPLAQEPPAAAERRSEGRHLTLFRVGTLLVEERRELCLIKNMSAGGMMLRLYCPMKPGQRVAVELKNGIPIAGQISWLRGDEAGVAFDTPIDVAEVLANDDGAPRPRMPRIGTAATILVRLGASTHRGQALDISQGGVKVALPVALPAAEEVVISLFGLPPLAGTVRWSDGSHAGLSFNRLLPLPELVAWLQAQRRAQRTG